MYELVQVGEHSYYMDCPVKVGFYRTGENEVVLIDGGSDKDAAKKIRKILDAQGWTLKAIFNTHSHADHIGGNQYLQTQTGCQIYAPGIERDCTEHPLLEPTMLFGGFAMKDLRCKFLMAKESDAAPLTEAVLPEGLQILPLPGHCYDMVGFRTKDGVVFLADCLSSEETLEKYQIGFIYDVAAYLDTLETVKTLRASCFVPAHAAVTENIAPLAQVNIDKTKAVAETVRGLLTQPKTFEDLLADVFAAFDLTMNLTQRMLVGSSVKSYLSYLCDAGRIAYTFENNKMLWYAQS
ncbi:MAG: MBL fold metallo-hydrolase [Clostridia bacterium]|nr:MBL fold metallo-hydrolase [Clostridia bacterium]